MVHPIRAVREFIVCDLRLQFEATSRLDADEKRVIKEVVESMLIKHESHRWLKQEKAS